MKRKLIAIFAACITLTCSLASCGDSDESESEKSSRKKNSSSDVSDKDDIDDKDSDNNDDDDDSDDNKKEKSTKDSDKKENEKTTAASDDNLDDEDVTKPDEGDDSDFGGSDEAIGGDVTGYWELPDTSEEKTAMGFDGNGSGSILVDATSIMHFTSDRKFYMEDMEFEAEFDGKTITVSADASDFGTDADDVDMDLTILTLERTDGSDASGLDGEYSLTGGMMGEALAGSFSEEFNTEADIPVYMIIEGENFGVKLDKMFTYSTDGNMLTISGLDAISDELDGIESGEVPYSVNGNKLTIFDDNGDIITMPRFEY